MLEPPDNSAFLFTLMLYLQTFPSLLDIWNEMISPFCASRLTEPERKDLLGFL
jgi:hypothetical protein